MLSALARSAQVFDEATYVRPPCRGTIHGKAPVRSEHGRLTRRYRDGQADIDGLLEDYAFLMQGLLDLYETSFDTQWLRALAVSSPAGFVVLG